MSNYETLKKKKMIWIEIYIADLLAKIGIKK